MNVYCSTISTHDAWCTSACITFLPFYGACCAVSHEKLAWHVIVALSGHTVNQRSHVYVVVERYVVPELVNEPFVILDGVAANLIFEFRLSVFFKNYNWLFKLRKKRFGKVSLGPYPELLFNFGAILFQEYVYKGITHPVFYGLLVYKLRSIKGESEFSFSSGSKIVKRLRRRQYDQAIIERTICLVLDPFTTLYRSFLKRCTLPNKAVGTIWRALLKPPQRRQSPDPCPIWL